MSKKMNLVGGAFAATTLAALGVSLAPAYAASSMESEYTHASCEGKDAICGVIVVASAGSFTLDWNSVDARDSQPAGPPPPDGPLTHPKCPGLYKKIERNVPSGNYNKFTLPASCAYKVKLKILSGNGKDENLYLTPGCVIKAMVEGDLGSNKWVLDVSAVNNNIPTNSNKKPIDQGGYKCGRQKNAGF